MKYTLVAVNQPERFPILYSEVVTQYKTYAVEEDRAVIGDAEELVGGFVTLDDGHKYWVHINSASGFIVKREVVPDPDEVDPVIKQWGPYEKYMVKRSKGYLTAKPDAPLFNWFVNYFVANHAKYPIGSEVFNWRSRLHCFVPVRSKISVGKISVYKDLDMRLQDRQTAMKPGRAISAMFPELDHKQVIVLTDDFLNKFRTRDFKLSVGTDKSDFKEAYSWHQSEMENIETTCTRKSSASSCMRYDFDHLKCHPAEVYGSGDFEVIKVSDGNDRIAGRCVVYTAHVSGVPQAGPMYGVSEQALDMIEAHLVKIGAEFIDPNWSGSKLIAIRSGSVDEPSFIGPYLDVEPRSLFLSECGKFLIQGYDGEIDASQYQGILSEAGGQCECCGDRVNPDDCMYSEHYGGDCCDYCFNENHFYCEYAEEHFHVDDMKEAYSIAQNGRKLTLHVSEYALEHSDFVECSDDNHWHIDDAHFCESEDCFISPDCMDEYFISDWDGELYPLSDLCTTTDGELVAYDEMKDSGDQWIKNSQNQWAKQEEEKECTV